MLAGIARAFVAECSAQSPAVQVGLNTITFLLASCKPLSYSHRCRFKMQETLADFLSARRLCLANSFQVHRVPCYSGTHTHCSMMRSRGDTRGRNSAFVFRDSRDLNRASLQAATRANIPTSPYGSRRFRANGTRETGDWKRA
jgi:hypothetical protein